MGEDDEKEIVSSVVVVVGESRGNSLIAGCGGGI